MTRSSLLMLAVAIGFAPTGECRAQVGFRAQQTWVNSGGSFSVAPITTHANRYARMGINVGFSQLVDVHTFSPVRGYSGLTPVNPIGGFGFGRPNFNPGLNPGYGLPYRSAVPARPPMPRPTVNRFVVATRKFDQDKDGRLNRSELEKVALAVVAELKRTPGVNFDKLARGGQAGQKDGKPLTDKEITDAFVKQCLNYDRDQDQTLNKAETKRMAAALIRSLG